jgi:ribosomal protein L11 methyltransferase
VEPLNGKKTPWLEICISAHPVTHEALGAFLFDMGCVGTAVGEGAQGETLIAYFPGQEGSGHVQSRIHHFLQELKGFFPQYPSPSLESRTLEDQDWSRDWRRFFHADRVTSRLLVMPEWDPIPASSDGYVIRIDPGPAFGTGKHATTRMCLEAMEGISLSGLWNMLDVGTGSGILAIYGAMLGARPVEAIDVDPEAIRWARHNIRLNGVSSTIHTSLMPLEDIQGPFCVITANLVLVEILRIFKHFPKLLKPGGCLILSGILKAQIGEIENALSAYGFCEHEALYQEEWACVIGIRSGGS